MEEIKFQEVQPGGAMPPGGLPGQPGAPGSAGAPGAPQGSPPGANPLAAGGLPVGLPGADQIQPQPTGGASLPAL